MKGPRWSDFELAYLRKNYGKIRVEEMHPLLARRPPNAIREKARRLGLRSTFHRQPRTGLPQSFYDGVLQEFAGSTMSQIAARRGVPTGTVSSWVSRARWRGPRPN